MDAMNRVVQSSRIGAAIFSSALGTELCAAVRNRIEAATRSFCSEPVSLEALSLAMFHIHGSIQSLPNLHMLPPQRDTASSMARRELHARELVGSGKLRFAEQLEAQAVRSGVPQLLRCEDVLDAGVQKLPGCCGTCDGHVVRHVSLVRAQRAESFKVSGTTDRERVVNVVKFHKAKWLMGDASFSPRACDDAGTRTSEASLDQAGIGPLVCWRRTRLFGSFPGSETGAARDRHDGVSVLREVYVMAKAKEGTATNKVCELFKLVDFFAHQDIRQDFATSLPLKARGLRTQGMLACSCRTRLTSRTRTRLRRRSPRSREGRRAESRVRRSSAVFSRPQRSFEIHAVPRTLLTGSKVTCVRFLR